MEIRGIVPPVATPMQPNEDLDLPRLEWFIDHLISEGVHGIFVLGTNSEFYALDEREKQEVIATTVAHVNRRLPVFAGTGAETTREVVRLTQMAEREGVDGVSVITPYFVKPTQQEIFQHYQRVAENTSLPVMLYNNPGTCGGVKIDVDTVARLTEISNIVGIKDSSGDLQNTCELIRVVPDSFSVLQGRDTLIYQALISGAKGAVPASGNVAPRLIVDVYDAVQRGDHAAALEAQRRLSLVRMSLNFGTAPGGVKTGLDLLGLGIGPCRSPVAAWDETSRKKMRQALQQAGLRVEG